MSILSAFSEWMLKTAQLKVETTTRNPDGTIEKVFTATGAPFNVGKWVDSVNVTDLQNKFVDDKLETFVADPAAVATVPKRGDILTVDGDDYGVIGVDDTIAELGEVLLIKVRAPYG